MSQEYEFITVARANGRATLSLNRPPLNVLNIPMIEEINRALADLREDATIKVLLIRGEGKCFSAGMDVADHLPETFERMLAVFHRMLEHLAALPIPTVSAVHGAALGGGLELAVFADMTFAAAGAKLGQPEIKLAVFPPLAAAYFPGLIGWKRACDVILTGRTIGAEDAERMGLVTAVFPDDALVARVDEIVRTLAGYSRPVLVATKRAIREAAGRPLFEGLELAERIYRDEVMATEDAVEGLRAFLEKRAPQWKDR
ncbi:MAG: enoyl-CoA hydratase/isomerase family protein [Acidobacteria bacterium]|nr:MAG: enoyl-CoA hydratase/isomerase family protein [Acidobacteriota bacterium]